MNNMVFTYIEILEELSTGKTKRFTVNNRKSGKSIGEVRWYSQWHQYCFFPIGGTVFSVGCLKDINSFINKTMDEHAALIYAEK